MKEYFKYLDSLRFYAVFSVIFAHLPLFSLGEHNIFRLFYLYIPGVPLFFCISGFLISGIIIQNIEGDTKQLLKSFYARRFLRIFPIYYLSIFALFIVNIDNYRDWFINDLLYISNIVLGLKGSFPVGNFLPVHFWSLAVEEQFYLFWPGLMLIFRTKKAHYLLGVFLVFLGLGATLATDFSFFMARTLTCLCYLGGGSLLAFLYYYHAQLFESLKKYFSPVLLVFLVFLVLQSLQIVKSNSYIHFFLSITMIPLLTARFIVGFESKAMDILLANPVILYLGKISYGLYVYHMFALFPAILIQRMFSITFLDDPMYMTIFKVIITIIISALSWEFLEKRINKLKKRFRYQRAEDLVSPNA